MSQNLPPKDWYPDPSGRFDLRYWDGDKWTGHVAKNGEQSFDDPESITATTVSTDPNEAAIAKANLDDDVAQWLLEVAGQVDERLDLVNVAWRQQSGLDTIRSCAFGLLLGYLSLRYPLAEPVLSDVAELHPSFVSLPESKRLATLRMIAGEPERAAAWLGPLMGESDPKAINRLYADGAVLT